MKERKYRHRTKVLGIPVPGFNHPILPSVEMKKWQFVENLLMASTRGMSSCVFDEGVISVKKEENGDYTAKMSSSSGGRSISGIAGGRYFECRKSVEWDSLQKGRKYFLYMVSNVKTSENPRSVRAVASRYRVPTSSVLVAEVDLKGEVPKVNIEPSGKSSRRMMESHVGKTENPHGATVFQEELGVKNLAIVGTIEVDEDGPINKQGLKEAASMAWVTRRIESKADGVVVTVDGTVKDVSISFEEEPESDDVVWAGYHGSDAKASKPEKVVIYNKYDGIALRISILCER